MPRTAGAAAGTYHVTLTVTDNREAPQRSPTTSLCWRRISFRRRRSPRPPRRRRSPSTRAPQTIRTAPSRPGAWDFGDGSSGAYVSPNHTYAASGTYTVQLVVTDDRNGTASVSHDVSVVANAKPTAAFTSAKTFLQVAFDGTGSTDSDGTVSDFAWDFGDNSKMAAAQARTTPTPGPVPTRSS